MSTLLQDLKYSLRMLAKNPGFTAVAVLTLALGIGANTAIFSVANSLLLRPLPVKDSGQLVVLAFRRERGPISNEFSYADFDDIRSQSTDVFSDVIAYHFGIDGLSVEGKPSRILSNYVSGDYFAALGIRPVLGRLILGSEGKTPGADPVLVLGHKYWKTQFGGDPNMVGKKVTVDGHPFTVIGVAPEGFRGLHSLLDTQGYMPYAMSSIEGGPADFMTNRALATVLVVARRRPEVSLQRAQAALDLIAKRISREHPESNKGMTIRAFRELQARPQPDASDALMAISALFLGLTALVLVLACINVANILLVRTVTREREMAIRAALGAGRRRLIAQLLTESVVLALFGGAAGIFLGLWASSLIGSVPLRTELPVVFEFGFDWRVFVFALAAALLAGILVGIIPALRASRRNLNEILHEGGRTISFGRHRLRSTLVVAQVAGSLMLLVVAGLFTRSLQKAQRSDLGFDPQGVLNLTLDPSQVGYDEAQGREFYKQLLDRVRALPGVQSASLAAVVPMGYYNQSDTLQIEGYETPPGRPGPSALYNQVSPDYFQTLRIPLVRGRAFSDADDQNSQYVAVINETMAARYWPNQDPLGRRFTMKGSAQHSIEVVGVAKNSRDHGFSSPIGPYFYIPLTQNYGSLRTLQVRTTAAPEIMTITLEKELASLAPGLPAFDVQTMVEALDTLNGLLIFELGAGLAAALGLLGLLLAVVGVYGVISFAVSQRTHEIGIRLALGAEPVEVLKMVLRQGLIIVAAGIIFGLLGAFAAARLVAGFLVGVSPADPVTFVGVSLLMTAVALLASYVPARRATKVDPMVALRYE